ncbi:PREDICTED: digestive cysteine proteinase 1-like isoform X2 [Gavialis gangeticus]|uniref:digestive cysteine proteinase 1-like isoform X1 n=1 Tax=Gavialis gangeticus TaxID=94835 RepID=UPI00092FBEDF|nr:PREDICTED: digestive cysteine proteinase 1-like isoform X1 [Gavialis gangeticus]XP_019368056.1 PREDICTED: digestive cysteine proteinase 1-like isoform X2 [Gavialis gangeticus]
MGLLMLLLWSTLLGAECRLQEKAPAFGEVYHVTGVLHLPYAEIKEPFEAWYNLSGKQSRIQYYNGQVITYQFGAVGPFGASFKVTPETTETEVNVRKCFRVNGTDQYLITPQSIFPSLDGFKPVREEYYQGQLCRVWQNVSYWGRKKNLYTLRVASSAEGPAPVHYEMRGFNTLLGSHYDKYEIHYTSFSRKFPAGVFSLPQGITCEHWPGAGPEHWIMANPMQEFVGRSGDADRAHHHLFHHYQEKFGKRYSGERELEHRKHAFIHNMRYVHSKNRANLPYKLALNHLADRTPEEMAVLRGRLKSGARNNGHPFPAHRYRRLILPESLDWRLYGAVTPVKDQAVCGSCWSFATTGALEGALFLQTGELTPLSQQALIDCSWGFGNHACDGGEEWQAYEWIMKHGIASTESYGPYLGQNGYCHSNQSEPVAKVAGYLNVAAGNATALKAALYKHGPVAVNIDASHKSFAFYSSGVYYEPACGNELNELDHAVLAVGYGVLQGESYWLIKNSWSTYWGNDGYILMAMRDNNCGVATAATYPFLA